MKNLISNKIKKIKPSLLDSFFNEASKQKDILSLSVGEPDFITPWHISVEGIKAIQEGKTFYTPSIGLYKLRKAISNHILNKYRISFSPNQILITNGASEAIDIVMRGIINHGDEIILTDPGYVSYEPCVIMAGGKPIHLHLCEKDSFKINPQILKRLITSKTKAIIINYPNNPTGAIMTKDELNEIVKICCEKNVLIVSDEIYSDLVYVNNSGSVLQAGNNYLDSIIYINGLSKSYSMTGWRIGYIVASRELINCFQKIHQYSTMCPSTISQYAGVEAINNGDSDIEMMRNEYLHRRNYLVNSLKEIGLPCSTPEGAFYVFPSIKKFKMKSLPFCEQLLEKEKLAIIPGIAFGDEGEYHIRISYAYSFDDLEKSLKKIKLFLLQFN